MHRFWDLIVRDVLEDLAPEVLVEIGSQAGEGTRKLLDFCEAHKARLHVIDPEPPANLESLQPRFGAYATFHRALSRDALPEVEPAQAYLIDGDHNYYTVITELRLIAERADLPLLILHDVEWPYGRRDLYYDPSNIPAESLNAHRQAGLRPGVSGLIEDGGMNPHLHHAETEGGDKNGVKTAVEDFVAEQQGAYEFVSIPGLSGLGFVFATGRREEVFARRIRDFLEVVEKNRGLVELVEAERLKLMERMANLEVKLRKARANEAALERTTTRAQNNAQRVYELTKQIERMEASRGYQLVEAARNLKRRVGL